MHSFFSFSSLHILLLLCVHQSKNLEDSLKTLADIVSKEMGESEFKDLILKTICKW